MRIVKKIEIEGKEAVALFNTGSWHTYVRETLIVKVPKRSILKSYKIALGGKIIEVKEKCIIMGKIEGFDFDTEAVPVDEIGKIDGFDLDTIIGAVTMEEWEIKLDPKTGSLDLEGLRRREFTEF